MNAAELKGMYSMAINNDSLCQYLEAKIDKADAFHDRFDAAAEKIKSKLSYGNEARYIRGSYNWLSISWAYELDYKGYAILPLLKYERTLDLEDIRVRMWKRYIKWLYKTRGRDYCKSRKYHIKLRLFKFYYKRGIGEKKPPRIVTGKPP